MNRVYSAASGEVVERPKALVLKTREERSSVGSNPTLSAKKKRDTGSLFFVVRDRWIWLRPSPHLLIDYLINYSIN